MNKKGLIAKPITLGHHLRNCRLSQGLTQEQVALNLGTIREVYDRWERDERQPVVSKWPLVLNFLGFYPGPQALPSDLTLMTRRMMGLDQKALAWQLGVIHQDVGRWENGEVAPNSSQLAKLRSLAASPWIPLGKGVTEGYS